MRKHVWAAEDASAFVPLAPSACSGIKRLLIQAHAPDAENASPFVPLTPSNKTCLMYNLSLYVHLAKGLLSRIRAPVAQNPIALLLIFLKSAPTRENGN